MDMNHINNLLGAIKKEVRDEVDADPSIPDDQKTLREMTLVMQIVARSYQSGEIERS